MNTYDAEETASLLSYGKLADGIRAVALDPGVLTPERMSLPLANEGTLLVMPAADGNLAITKLVSVHPKNVNLPTIQGEVVVMDAKTGERLGILDGATVTARRTAALSLLAAKELAHRPSGALLIVGAGTQARSHLEAFREGLGIQEVFISSRTDKNAESLARHAEDLGVETKVVEEPDGVLGEVSLIVTATTSEAPVIGVGENVAPGTFVAAVGAFKPGMAELSPALIEKSSVVVDTLEGAKSEAGDLISAREAGAFEWSRAVELREILENGAKNIPPESPTIFKSVGSAMWDLASARAAFD